MPRPAISWLLNENLRNFRCYCMLFSRLTHILESEIPFQVRCHERGDKAAARSVHVYRYVKAALHEKAVYGLDVFIFASVCGTSLIIQSVTVAAMIVQRHARLTGCSRCQ